MCHIRLQSLCQQGRTAWKRELSKPPKQNRPRKVPLYFFVPSRPMWWRSSLRLIGARMCSKKPTNGAIHARKAKLISFFCVGEIYQKDVLKCQRTIPKYQVRFRRFEKILGKFIYMPPEILPPHSKQTGDCTGSFLTWSRDFRGLEELVRDTRVVEGVFKRIDNYPLPHLWQDGQAIH